MMTYGAKTRTSGGGPLETVGKMSHSPHIHMQGKKAKNIPHQILTESEAQIHTDTNNNNISKH